MAGNLKKASLLIRKSFRSKLLGELECKENLDSTTSGVQGRLGSGRFRARTLSTSASSCDEAANVSTVANPGSPVHDRPRLRRGTSMTQSMRGAVGTLRQKLRMSTRRARLNVTPTRVSTRRHTIGGRGNRVHPSFKISTPTRSDRSHTKTCLTLETPTRLRREVESLTSNMQALSALTPNTLENRTRTRKSPLLTNGSLKSGRLADRRVTTEIN